jgi:hypothetical protein
MDAPIQRSAKDATLRLVKETLSSDPERVGDRIGRMREAFQGELFGVVDRLVTAAAAEADAAVEKARMVGQVALDAALIQREQRARQCNELTESVRQLEIQVEELRLALHAERELVKTAAHKFEQELNARARAEAASEEARRLQERLMFEYESKVQAVQTELDAERTRIRGLTRQLEAQASERSRLLTTLKTVQQACALAEANDQPFEVDRLRAEQPPDHEIAPDVHTQSAATARDDGARGNDPAAAESKKRVAAPPTDPITDRKLRFVGTDQRRTVEVPSSLAAYTKPLFPRETPITGDSSGVKTEEGTPRKPRSRTSL